MKKIIVVGSINMDLVICSDRQPEIGETMMGNKFFTSPGGKGANQAVAVAKLGGNISMIGCVGDDLFGKSMLENFDKYGVDTKNIKICKDSPTGVAVVNVVQGDNSIIINSGANFKLSNMDIQKLEDVISQHEIMLIGHEVSDEVIEASVRIAVNHNIKVILNPAPARQINEWVLKNIDFLTPNLTEAELLTETKISDEEGVKRAIELLRDKGVNNVIMTLGKYGVAFNTGNEVIFKRAPKVNVKDTTGAGDTFNGAFAVKLSQGFNIEESVAFSIVAASLAVTKIGAQNSIPEINEVVEHFLR